MTDCFLQSSKIEVHFFLCKLRNKHGKIRIRGLECRLAGNQGGSERVGRSFLSTGSYGNGCLNRVWRNEPSCSAMVAAASGSSTLESPRTLQTPNQSARREATEYSNINRCLTTEDIICESMDCGFPLSQLTGSPPYPHFSAHSLDLDLELEDSSLSMPAVIPFPHVKGNLTARERRRLKNQSEKKSLQISDKRNTATSGRDGLVANKLLTDAGDHRNVFDKDYVLSLVTMNLRTPLLTKEQEVSLTNKFKAASKLESLRARFSKKQGEEISFEQLASMTGVPLQSVMKAVKDGVQAQDKLITSNLRLVMSVAKTFYGRGLQFEDLMQFGMLGLIRGIQRFDPSRGYKLSTYVHWWIRQGISRALANHSHSVRMPAHVHEDITRYYRVKHSLMAEGSPATMKDIATAMRMSEDKLKKILKARVYTTSLDSPRKSPRYKAFDKKVSHYQVLADLDNPDPMELIEREFVKVELHKLVDTLNSREQSIIRNHFGIGPSTSSSLPASNVPLSLEDISKRHGISRERARQLENIALRRLKVLSSSSPLESFLSEM